MPINLLIRPEKRGDESAITDVTTTAFDQVDEAALIARLRRDGDAVLSLVAEIEGRIIGHVLLSSMRAPFQALGLAPISVHPKWQNQGVGSALMHKAIDIAKGAGWDAIFLLGDPGYYSRFGFDAGLASSFISPYAGPYFMVLPLSEAFKAMNAPIAYAPAFDDL